ncbi:MAG: hypothetical protein KJ607_00705, partial [Bacteroidetes bacterium]|nr:hypothetical protein [Bacteroidota bacterium]
KFVTENMLRENDIISARKEYIAGHFTLFRNTPEVNSLYTDAASFEKIFLDKKLYFFDECGGYCEELLQGRNLQEINNCLNMTSLANKKNSRNIKVIFTTFVQEDQILEAYKKRTDWEFLWSAGKLTCDWDKKEVMYLHLLSSKKNPAFTCFHIQREEMNFRINRQGIFLAPADV